MQFISAELLAKQAKPEIFDTVTWFMIHGPCGRD